MVERRLVHTRLLLRVEGLHEIDLDLERTAPEHRDVLVDVLLLAAEVAADLETEDVYPELTQLALVGRPEGDLLDTENFEWTRAHERPLGGGGLFIPRRSPASKPRGALASRPSSPFPRTQCSRV